MIFKDKRTPIYLKLLLVFALIYFVSPMDIIPEIILPGFGLIDDALLLVIAFKYFIKLAPGKVVEEYVKQVGRNK